MMWIFILALAMFGVQFLVSAFAMGFANEDFKRYDWDRKRQLAAKKQMKIGAIGFVTLGSDVGEASGLQ